jgi:hypothetical protein
VQTAQQLNSDDLRNVPGAEEHALERHIQVTQTPVRKELIVEHSKQYRGSGNVLSRRDPRRHADVSTPSHWAWEGQPDAARLPLLQRPRRVPELEPLRAL